MCYNVVPAVYDELTAEKHALKGNELVSLPVITDRIHHLLDSSRDQHEEDMIFFTLTDAIFDKVHMELEHNEDKGTERGDKLSEIDYIDDLEEFKESELVEPDNNVKHSARSSHRLRVSQP